MRFLQGMEQKGQKMDFGKKYYAVQSIEGDYAYLLNKEDLEAEAKCVARALLPEAIKEGSVLIYEMMEYTLASE